MKNLTLVILFSIAGSVGCTGSIPGLTAKPRATRTDDLMFTLKRNACYGTCPVYELTIDGEGNVAFQGMENTRTIGKAAGKISSHEVDRLIEEFNSAGFLELGDTYDQTTCPEFATDMSTVTVSLRQNGETKTVLHNLGCSTKVDHKPFPPGLRELETKIDAAARSAQWVKGSP